MTTTAKLTSYLIYRHGSNTANQSMCNRAPVAIVEATSRDEATRTVRHDGAKLDFHAPSYLALDESVDCWANQHFTAVPQSRAKAIDWNAVAERDQPDDIGPGYGY
jgi:hypothetical protein